MSDSELVDVVVGLQQLDDLLNMWIWAKSDGRTEEQSTCLDEISALIGRPSDVVSKILGEVQGRWEGEDSNEFATIAGVALMDSNHGLQSGSLVLVDHGIVQRLGIVLEVDRTSITVLGETATGRVGRFAVDAKCLTDVGFAIGVSRRLSTLIAEAGDEIPAPTIPMG